MRGKNLGFSLNKITSLTSQTITWFFRALLLFTVICIVVPFSPLMPGSGLDQSWAFGMNQAVAQGLGFGREMIFTFGPYASIYTRTYHPATDHLMLVASLYLSLSYGLAIFLVTRGSKWHLLAALWLVLAGLGNLYDALFFSYPLLVGLFCYQETNEPQRIAKDTNMLLALTAILFLPFGLLPLIKGSNLILCGAIAILAAALFAKNRRWGQVIVVIISPIISILFFWVVADQSAWDLPSYFISIALIVSGYTEAMSSNGNGNQIVFYFVAALVLLLGVLRAEQATLGSRIFILLVFSVYLFLAFKGGFVRHDGHAVISSSSILIASVLFAIVFRSTHAPAIFVVSIIAWMSIDIEYVKTSTQGVTRNIESTYYSAWNGLQNRLSNSAWLETEFSRAVKNLNGQANIPVFEGTTDIYSYNQAILITSGNDWNPRPILQSYSAYTPTLMLINRNHLLGESAPDNVIFKVEPIDGRLPSIEDGASWSVLLSNYDPGLLENEVLYLHKISSAVQIPEESLINKGSYLTGEEVLVPRDSDLIFTEISIKKSLIGTLMSLLYKPSQLNVSINLENGSKRTYRIIAGMVKTGFLISPLIESTNEFALLYGGSKDLSAKRVHSFSIAPAGQKGHWKNYYEVTFKKLEARARVDL